VAGAAPWPFSCEVVVGLFSKLGEQTQGREEELQEVADPRVDRVDRVGLRQVARDRHSERDRVSCERGDIRTQSGGFKSVHTSLDRTLHLVGTWHVR